MRVLVSLAGLLLFVLSVGAAPPAESPRMLRDVWYTLDAHIQVELVGVLAGMVLAAASFLASAEASRRLGRAFYGRNADKYLGALLDAVRHFAWAFLWLTVLLVESIVLDPVIEIGQEWTAVDRVEAGTTLGLLSLAIVHLFRGAWRMKASCPHHL